MFCERRSEFKKLVCVGDHGIKNISSLQETKNAKRSGSALSSTCSGDREPFLGYRLCRLLYRHGDTAYELRLALLKLLPQHRLPLLKWVHGVSCRRCCASGVRQQLPKIVRHGIGLHHQAIPPNQHRWNTNMKLLQWGCQPSSREPAGGRAKAGRRTWVRT